MGLMVEESREAKKYVRRLQGIIAEEIKNNRISYELNITEEDSIDISESIKYMYNADIENLGSVVKIVGKDVSSRDSVVKIHRFLENELATFREESREIKNRQYSQDELDEVNESRKELRLEEFISQNKYIPIFGELFNVLYSDELESRIVAEAVLIAKIIASTHGVMVCSTMNIHSAVVAYWAFNVNKKLRLKSNSGALVFTLKDDKDKLYNIEEISFREFLKKLFKEDDAVDLAIKELKEFGKEEHRADRAFVDFFEDFIRVIKKQLKNVTQLS